MENTSQSSDMLADWKNLKNCRRRSIKHLSNVATEIEKKIQERKFIIKLFEVDIDIYRYLVSTLQDMTKSYCQMELMRMNQTVSDYVHMHKQIEKHKADAGQINNSG